jgi:NAD(P)H-hydrate epimerase
MDIPVASIFTPHPKEFDRLFGEHKDQDERKKTAFTKAKESRIIIVLKGHETFITNGKESFINTTGNAGLAKGGSGDALTGMFTAFLAQHYDPFTAAKLGVYLHGLAADIAVGKQSEESLLISDVIEALGEGFRRITNISR